MPIDLPPTSERASSTCTFCSIVAKHSRAEIVFQDDHVTAFMDALPMTRGHLLIVPNMHRRDLLDLGAEDGGQLMRVASRIGEVMVSELGAKGLNLLHNTGAHADQSQFHFHFHLIPRYGSDRLLHPWERTWGNWTHIAQHAQQLRGVLQSDSH
jgi:histidine triad (HIT) family protein